MDIKRPREALKVSQELQQKDIPDGNIGKVPPLEHWLKTTKAG